MFLPKDILKKIHIGEGMTVVDIGSGIGHFAIHIGELVGPYGKVFALDIHDDLLVSLKNEAKRRNIKNIFTLKVDVEKEFALKGTSADRVIMANLLFQLENKEETIKSAVKLLKKHGKIVVIDWLNSFNHLGPHPKHIVSKSRTLELFKKVGLELEAEIEVGDHHYGLVFKRRV